MSNNNNKNKGKKNRQRGQPKTSQPKGRGARKRGNQSQANSKGRTNQAFSAPELHFAPVAIGAKMTKSQPIFEKTAGQQRIIHREKIAKVASGGTGAFSVLKTIALNPGVAASFPWLSNESAGYESYRFNRLRYVWIPSIGSAVAGNVIMGPDYDAADPAPVGETALSSYVDSDEERVWCPLAVECNPEMLNGSERRKFVRLGVLAANQDIKTYDSGNFFVAVTDDAAVQTGKLWVEYDVTLYNPQVPPGGFFQTVTMSGTTANTAALPFGTAGTEIVRGAPTISVSGLAITITGAVIGQVYAAFVELTGTVMSVLTVANTSGSTVSTSKNTLIGVGSTEIGALNTFTATAETVVLTLAVTATTVTAGRFLLTVEAPSNF